MPVRPGLGWKWPFPVGNLLKKELERARAAYYGVCAGHQCVQAVRGVGRLVRPLCLRPPAAGHCVLGQEEPSWLGRPALDAPQMGNEPGEAVACLPPSLSAATVRDGSACEARPRVSLCSRLLSGRLWSASCVLEKAPVPTEPLAWTSARVIRGRRHEVSRSPQRAHRVPPQPDSEEART